jgi:murein DD-endopeptidase MepM/ murein hydrolase activator NlpD
MLGLAYALALSCFAVPPIARGGGVPRPKAADLEGESHVPGFARTPALVTREYGDAFVLAEADAPDLERMLHACKHPGMGLAVITFLPRYCSPRLVEPARKLARSADPVHQAGAISGLISLLDNAPETRTFVRGLLRASNPAVRGRAAEYLCWLGGAEDYLDLTKLANAESDVHARAALVAAAAAIKHRAAIFGAGAAATPTPGTSPTATYQEMAGLLAAPATAATRQALLERLRSTEVFEPITRFSDRLEHGERGAALLRAQRLLAGYPETADAPERPRAAPAVTLPVARSLIAPVRDYFDARRKSYGSLVSAAPGGSFSGKTHVGDDVAWRKDHETVVAIAHGIVRSVELGRKSWGGLVVVEHADAAGGRFCSLYGHLGPLVCVRPGEVVRQGHKLGVVGTSYSHANGGYLAHLHFGIHRGAFLLPDRVGALVALPGQAADAAAATVTTVTEHSAEVRLAHGATRSVERSADWMCGYLTPAEFATKTHGWVAPQEFIQKFKF